MLKSISMYLLLALMAAGLYVAAFSQTTQSQPTGLAYVGPEYCGQCHVDKYQEWQKSGHSSILLTASEAEERGYPLPEGITWDQVLFTVGGKWKILYVNTTGYIITWHYEDGQRVPGASQWNVQTKRWADYKPGEEVPYDCGVCHTTGFNPEGHAAGRPGIVGTWVLNGVTCERCHGPGGGADEVVGPHKGTGTPLSTLEDPILCAWCHVRTSFDNILAVQNYTSLQDLPADLLKSITDIDAENGLILNHEQFEEWYNSPHARAGVTCVTCHDPHLPAEESFKTECSQCHVFQAAVYESSTMAKLGVECIDCHMPPIVKSAEGRADIYFGDVRSHLFRINTSADAELTYVGEDGKEYANPYIPLGYSCGQPGCHGVAGFVEGTLTPILSNRVWDTRKAAEVVANIQGHTSEKLDELKARISEVKDAIKAYQDAGVPSEYIQLVTRIVSSAESIQRAVENDGSLGVHNPDVDVWMDEALQALTSIESFLELVSRVGNVSVGMASVQAKLADLEGKAAQLDAIASDLNKATSDIDYLNRKVSGLDKRVQGIESNLSVVEELHNAITNAEQARNTSRSSMLLGAIALAAALISLGLLLGRKSG